MDSIGYRIESFDVIIKNLINNQLDAEQFVQLLIQESNENLFQHQDQLLQQHLNQFKSDNQSNSFISYFLFNLHAACSWIIYGINLSGSQQCSPVKSLSKQTNSISSPIESKKNLFARFELSETKQTPRTNKQPLDLGDQDAFPNLMTTPKNGSSKEDSFTKKRRACWSVPTSSASLSIVQSPTSCAVVSNASRSAQDHKRNRRIKPTSLKESEQCNNNSLTFGQVVSKDTRNADNYRRLFDQSPLIEPCEENVRAERQQLKNELQNLTPSKSNRSEILDKIITPMKNLDLLSVPCLAKVTFTALQNVSRFYTCLIHLNLITNVVNELEFIVHLLSRRVNAQECLQDTCFEFATNYHNCVYFAALSIQRLLELHTLDFMGTSFFRALCLNENLNALIPTLREPLHIRSQLVNEQENDQIILMPTCDFIAFQPETDSKENFPNDQSFHSFRKQRDAFFKLYYEWKALYEKNGFRSDTIHTNVDFRFSTKVHHIFGLNKEFGNYYHFCRLFIAQLSQCCVGWTEVTENAAENSSSGHSACEASHVWKDSRLKKLNQRFNFQDQKTMATQSSFVGLEQFFFQFILSSNNYCFLIVLRTLLIEKITELNNPALLIETLELDQNDTEAAALFSNCSLHLQLLSKFFGLLLFMPFYSKSVRSENFSKRLESLKSFEASEITFVRQLDQFIANAIKFGNLILTLPWVLQFLSQMDNDSHLFCNYESTLDTLVNIYYQLGRSDLDYSICSVNKFYLIVALGNFFDRCSALLSDRLLRKDLLRSEFLKGKFSRFGLDERCRVNIRFINDSFPRLFALKDLLRLGLHSQPECRKIKPLSLTNQPPPSTSPISSSRNGALNGNHLDNQEHQLQLEFEENFFRLHSQSLRKTVDFIADRLHSKCIKEMKHEFLKITKRKIISSHIDLSISAKILSEIKQHCHKYIAEFVSNHVEQLFELLVSKVDYDEPVLYTARSICSRITLEKCVNWTQNNLNEDWILNELLVENARRKCSKDAARKENEEDEGEGRQQKEPTLADKAPPASALLIPIPDIAPTFNQVRDLICEIYFDSKYVVQSPQIVDIIDKLRQLRVVEILPSKTIECIDCTMVDLLICLLANRPKVCDDSVLSAFTAYWSEQKLIVKRLISPRNLYILSISPDSYQSWNKFESIVTRLIRCFAYLPSNIESDILWSLNKKQEWSEKVLLKLGSVLKSVAESCKSFEEYKDSTQIVELIDWFSWFCSQQNLD